ncbi:MAG: hypothetical protein Q8L35_04975 [Actinomycetota bacterium]|nr:hypothetical protein [Actinomycetota bacterium]
MTPRRSAEPSPIGESRLERNQKRLADRLKKRLARLFLLLAVFVVLAAVLVFATLPQALRSPSAPVTPVFSITGLDRPLAVAVDAKRRIYVSDSGRRRLLVYDAGGHLLRRIGEGRRDADLKSLMGVTVDDRTGLVYVADWIDRSVKVFAAGGRPVRRFPEDPGDNRLFGPLGFTPFGLARRGRDVYATTNDGVYRFSTQGKLLKKIGARGAAPGEFNYPTAVAVAGPDGAIYVADQLNSRVVALSPGGKVKWILGRPTRADAPGLFALPRGIALDAKGRLYVSDTFLHRIVVLNGDGGLISVFGERGAKDVRFDFPEGLAVDGKGYLYVADRENNRVQILTIRRFPRPSKHLRRQWRQFFVAGGD